MLTFCFCYQQGAKYQLDMKTCVGYVSSIQSVEGVWRYLLIDGCDRIESHAFLVPYYQNKRLSWWDLRAEEKELCFTESQ